MLPRYRYRLKLRQNQTAEGIAQFKDLLAKQPENKRTELINEFLFDMAALDKLVEGYQAAPDAKQAFLILAEDFLEEGPEDRLKPLLDAHRLRCPDDIWLTLYQGHLHAADKEWDKAVQVLGAGWNMATKEQRDRFRYAYVQALSQTGRSLEAYRTIEPRDQTFNQLTSQLALDRKWTDLGILLLAHRAVAANDPDVLFSDARMRVGLKQFEEAGKLIRKAYDNQLVDYKRRNYASTFALDMEQAGKGLEGYRIAPDQLVAFETLARQCLSLKKEKELQALLDEHGKSHSKDPLYHYHVAELHLLRGEVGKAEQQFSAALANSSPQHEWMFRNGLNRARIKAGKAVDVYRETGAENFRFEELANLCKTDGNARQLEALIAARRETDPDDPDLPLWDLEVKWLDRDHEGAFKLRTEHRRGVFALPRHRWKTDDYLVRCLVKLKRTKEAIQEAEAIAKSKHGNQLPLVFAHAAQGDVKQTIAVVERSPANTYLIASFYQDPDLGPILRSDGFRPFRDRFPPPKKEETER
jgi:hypothetical protein